VTNGNRIIRDVTTSYFVLFLTMTFSAFSALSAVSIFSSSFPHESDPTKSLTF